MLRTRKSKTTSLFFSWMKRYTIVTLTYYYFAFAICFTCSAHLTREEETHVTGAGAIEKGLEGPREAKVEEEKLEGSMESRDEEKNLEGLMETGHTRLVCS